MKTVLNSRLLNSKCLIPIFRILLGGIFLAASISKIIDRSGSVSTVVGSGLLPRHLAQAYGWVIPWVKLYLGCSLVLGVLPWLAAAISLPVIVSFVVASSYALVKALSNRHSDDLRCNPEQCRWVFQFRLQRGWFSGIRSFESGTQKAVASR